MSYIQRSLGDGERVVALARFHWWYDVKTWLAIIVPAALLAAAFSYVPEMNCELFLYGAAAVMAIGIIIFLQRMIRKWTTEIGITSHRFVKKTGLISLHTNEFALTNIEGVKVTQDFWGRIWGYGHLRVEGTGDDAFEVPNIADPVGFRRAIETAKGLKDSPA